jgi:hypothetical protein
MSARAQPLAGLPWLGAGLSFQAALQGFVGEHADSFDFVEVIPDIFWNDLGPGSERRFASLPEAGAVLAGLAARAPLVGHGVGLSIGSAEPFDEQYLDHVAAFRDRHGLRWFSEHLSFTRLPDAHAPDALIDLGFTLPVPYDEAVLELLSARVARVQACLGVPFLLENNVYYFEIPEQELDEAEFLNRLCARSGCGLLLDLHNVYANARNHGFDPADFLARLDLRHVVEIHVAGGRELEGAYLDAHSGPCPEPVWRLLEDVLPRAPGVRGVVFEVFGGYYPDWGADGLRRELERLRATLARATPAT